MARRIGMTRVLCEQMKEPLESGETVFVATQTGPERIVSMLSFLGIEVDFKEVFSSPRLEPVYATLGYESVIVDFIQSTPILIGYNFSKAKNNG